MRRLRELLSWELGVTLCALVLCACSVDPKDHPDYKSTCKPGQHRVKYFCVPDAPDAGPDASDDDGGSAMDGAVADAAPPPERCSETGADDYCYPYSDSKSQFQPPCRPGRRTCGDDGFWGTCIGAVGPATDKTTGKAIDACDGLDNDCDGKTDEGETTSCRVGKGLQGTCDEMGVQICRDGKPECLQAVGPTSEICNGKDDDCDGKTDEGLEIACYSGSAGCTDNGNGGYDCVLQSTCAPGALRCLNGEMETSCQNDSLPGTERSTMRNTTPLDEDCDGMIDEGFSCQDGRDYPCYTGPANTRGRSPCKDGKQLCNGGHFEACMDERTPVAETCANEGEDDDCDDVKDDVPRRGMSCAEASNGMGICKQEATWQCSGGSEVCRNATPRMEACDGLMQDEDCDGKIDEGFNLLTSGDNCGACNNKCAAGFSCCNGSCVNTSTSNSHCGSCTQICATNLTCCASACVNTKSDAANCGMCGNSCLLLGCNKGKCNL